MFLLTSLLSIKRMNGTLRMGPTMPKKVNEQEERSRIRSAAIRVFARRGIARGSMDEVARAAGISRPGIYTYYPDRDSLVNDLVDAVLADEVALFQTCLSSGGTARARLESLARALARSFSELGPAGAIMLQLWAQASRKMRGPFRTIRRLTEKTLREGVQRGELPRMNVPMTARFVIAILDGVLLQHVVDPQLFGTGRALAKELVGAVHRALPGQPDAASEREPS